MHPTPPSWPRRFINATPSMPDGLWVGFVLLMVFMCGICAGIIWCGSQSTEDVRRLSLQHQLDALDTRLKTLESR